MFIVIIVVSGPRFAYHPTGFLPTDDQGYAMIIARLPDAASQPRVMAATQEVTAILRKTKGLKAWVTIGGFSILDFANVSNMFTTFIVYDDWDKRGAALRQDKIIGNLRRELSSIEDALVFVAVPPPTRGLGTSGGFQMMIEDRQSLGWPNCKRPRMRSLAPQFPVRLGQPGHHLQRPQPPALPGYRPAITHRNLQQLRLGRNP